MKIAVLVGTLPSTTFIDAFINAMAEHGCHLMLLGKRSGAYRYHKNVKVVELADTKIHRIISFISFLPYLKASLVKNCFHEATSVASFFSKLIFYLPLLKLKPDWIHVQWASALYQHELLFELFPNKILLSLRGAHINYSPILRPDLAETYRRLFPKVYKFHAVSNAIANEASKYGAELNKIQTIYSFVDEEVQDGKIVKIGDKDRIEIISVGRFHWKKGYEYALNALKEVKLAGIDFNYTVVAQGVIPESISFQIYQLGLTENVKIINGLSHKDVLAKIAKSNLFLLPSTEEGIANVVLEAMALGVPVISTNCGGMKEVIIDTMNGFLVELMDAEQIASKIIAFTKISTETKTLIIANAKDTIVRQHSKDKFVTEYLEFYS